MNYFKKRPQRSEIMNFLESLLQNPRYQKKIDQAGGEFFLSQIGKKREARLYGAKKIENLRTHYRINLITKYGVCENYKGNVSFDTGKKGSCGMGGMYSIKEDYNIECLVKSFKEFKEEILEKFEGGN